MREICEILIQILISSGIIWAGTMTLKRGLRNKLSPRAHLAVWLVLIVRLVMPITIETGLHFAVQPEESVCHVGGSAYPAQARLETAHEAAAVPDDDSELRRNPAVPSAPFHVTSNDLAMSWDADPAELTVAVWIIGMLVSAALSLAGYERMRISVKRRLVAGPDPVHLLFHECLEEVGVRRRVVLAVQSELAGPALMYPNIVLIPETVRDMPKEAVQMALRHELTHFVRRDHLRSMGLNVLRIVWWFNPFLYMAVNTIREDIETACDSDVVRAFSKEKKAVYARTVLAMYGRTETCRAVLGMAFGGTKKNAEKRIRGIYMKRKTSAAGRAAAICLAGILSMACLTTACQPTPEQQAVVNKLETIPEDALIGEGATIDPRASAVPDARYTAAEKWTQTIEKAENFKVIADTDVMMPEVTAYPVEKIAPREITQELADQMIDYFAPGTEFYRTVQSAPKEEIEERILRLREELASPTLSGDDADVIENMIEELTSQYDSAPSKAERESANTEFDYAYTSEGVSSESSGRNYISVSCDGPGASVKEFLVTRGDKESPWESREFRYVNAYFALESNDAATREQRADAVAEIAEKGYSDADSQQTIRLVEELDRRNELYAANALSPDTADDTVRGILERFGIKNMQMIVCDRALIAHVYEGVQANLPTDFADGTHAGLTEPGLYLEYTRENGGMPCLQPEVQWWDPNRGGDIYAAPFVPERVTALVDGDCNVRFFEWSSPSEAVEIVAQNSELIPVAEAEERLVEELYRAQLGIGSEYFRNGNSVEYDITELKLVMGYVSVKDEPDNMLAIPAWMMHASGRSSGEFDLVVDQDIMISALDGTPIVKAPTV